MSDALGPLPGLDELAVVVTPVADRFRRSGFRIYLVGGVVRDLVVARDRGRPLEGGDIDLTTDARPPDIKRLLEPLADVIWDQGERFGTIGARISGRILEVTTHRAEAYDPQSRKPVVSFGDHIADDLERRDFTINAAAIELPSGELHDPHRGLIDLRDRILRTPLSPEISFTDDPLRMLRAARFMPRFDLTPAPEVITAARELAGRLEIVSVERVADELERLLAVATPLVGFEFLVQTGLLPLVVPALGSLDAAGMASAVALASAPAASGADAETPDRPLPARTVLVRRAGLLWPVRHQAAEMLARLRYSRAETTRTVHLLEAAALAIADPEPPEPGGGPGVDAGGGLGVDAGPDPDPVSADGVVGDTFGPPSVRRLAVQVGPEGLVTVANLAANLAAIGQAAPDRVVRLIDLIGQLSRTEDLGNLDGPLSGAEVMEVLDLEPGPEVGRALAYLRELRIERGPFDADEARRELIARGRPGS